MFAVSIRRLSVATFSARRALLALAMAVLAIVVALVPTELARASFPGSNGRIAFTSTRDGEQRVWAMNAEGTMIRAITPNIHLFTPVRPRWSPDGSKIVMSENSFDPHVWVADVATGELTDLGYGTSPAWSPDGGRIAFVVERDICVMSADGSNRQCFFEDPFNNPFDDHPSWSPDGTRIAVQRVNNSHWDIAIMDAAGGNIAYVTNDADEDQFPDWSPDGSRIVFTRLAADYHEDIWTVNVDGSGLANLTPDAEWDTDPDWSPDGTQIVFKSHRDVGLFAMGADGSDLHAIVHEDFWEPDWSSVADLPIQQEPTELTIAIRHLSRDRVAVDGTIQPVQVDARLTMILYRRVSGDFRKVDRADTGPYPGGDYYWVAFSEPPPGVCKAVVKLREDVDSLATQVSKRFRCTG